MKVLVVSAHADDETLGMGGTILKHKTHGDEIYWLIFTKPWQPKWDSGFVRKRIEDVKKVADEFGFVSIIWFDYKDNRMDKVSMDEYQNKLINIIDDLRPEAIYFPNPWDLNYEHVLVSKIVEFSTKPPYTQYVRKLISYEIPSATEWYFGYYGSFKPNMYVDISKYIDKKLKILQLFSTEVKNPPHSRSLDYIKALARVRGGECGCMYAEAFHMFREVII